MNLVLQGDAKIDSFLNALQAKDNVRKEYFNLRQVSFSHVRLGRPTRQDPCRDQPLKGLNQALRRSIVRLGHLSHTSCDREKGLYKA